MNDVREYYIETFYITMINPNTNTRLYLATLPSRRNIGVQSRGDDMTMEFKTAKEALKVLKVFKKSQKGSKYRGYMILKYSEHLEVEDEI